ILPGIVRPRGPDPLRGPLRSRSDTHDRCDVRRLHARIGPRRALGGHGPPATDHAAIPPSQRVLLADAARAELLSPTHLSLPRRRARSGQAVIFDITPAPSLAAPDRLLMEPTSAIVRVLN